MKMRLLGYKKNTVCIFIVFFFGFNIVGNKAISQLLIGPKIGTGLSWMNFEDKALKNALSVDPIYTYNAGFMTALRVEKRFFLQTEFIYSRRGKVTKAKSISNPDPEDIIFDPSTESRLINHYFEIPITYRIDFKLALAKIKFRWFVGAGPNVSWWLKSKGSFKSGVLLESEFDEIDFTSEFDFDPLLPENDKLYIDKPNKIQLGFNIMSGIVFEPHPHRTVILNVRYDIGHSFLAKSDAGLLSVTNEYSEPLRVRNNAVVISLAYLFDTKIAERKKGKSTIRGKSQ